MPKPSTSKVPQDQLIGTVARVKREEVRVNVRTQGGMKWLDIRVYYQSETGEMRPSQRGVSLSPEEWKSLRQVLGKLLGKSGQTVAGTTA